MEQNPVIPNLFKFHRKAGLSSDVEKLYKGTWIEGDPGLSLCPNVHLAQCFQDLSQQGFTARRGFPVAFSFLAASERALGRDRSEVTSAQGHS